MSNDNTTKDTAQKHYKQYKGTGTISFSTVVEAENIDEARALVFMDIDNHFYITREMDVDVQEI